MQDLASRTTEYRQRIRSATIFDTLAERQQLENNDPPHYTFGDDVQNSSGFMIDDSDDNAMKNVDEIYIMNNSSCFINDENEVHKQLEDNQSNDDDDLRSFKSFESEYSSTCDVVEEVPENIE